MPFIGFEGTEEEEKIYGEKISEVERERIEDPGGTKYVDKEIYISDKRKAEIMAKYQTVIVQEFGDFYHLTDEERMKREKYYEAHAIAKNVRSKIKRLDLYVSAMRRVLECVEYIAEDNGIYDPEEFKLRWMKGKIVIDGVHIPKYTGKDKKRINWDYVAKFILSDRDPDEIIAKDVDHLDEDQIEDEAKILFRPGELEEMVRPRTEEEMSARRRKLLTDDAIRPLTKKEIRRVSKDNPSLILAMKEIKRKEDSLSSLNRSGYGIQYDDMERVDNYSPYKVRNDDDGEMPEFHGSFAKKSDVRKYEYDLRQYEKHHTFELYAGKMMTPAEIQELELKDKLAEEGWNIRKLFSSEKESRLREMTKINLKKEKKIKKSIMKMNQRNKKRRQRRLSR